MKKLTHSGSYHENTAKSRYLFLSCLFTFYSLIQLLLPMIKLNGVCQPITKEYKMVHGLNQVALRDSTLFIEGTELEIFTKSSLKKSLPRRKNMTKKSSPHMQLMQKKFVPRMLKKFIYHSGKVLLFETLNFQKEINSKRYASLNKQSY